MLMSKIILVFNINEELITATEVQIDDEGYRIPRNIYFANITLSNVNEVGRAMA